VSTLCEVLDNELCPELTQLNLRFNGILDEGVKVLCSALIEHQLFTLTQLYLNYCSLSDECIPSLCDLLTDERCNLTILSLSGNRDVGNEGLRMLCESALRKEHCKLKTLSLLSCSITDQCIPDLRNTLQDEHCEVKELSVSTKKFTQKGIKDLLEIPKHKDCKARGLTIYFYKR
jgi:Ran GTPase-activating protein (RanGAP) involved in mRNA processing and transport